MIVVGIDPGSQRTGFAAIEVSPALRNPKVLDIGVWNLMKLSAAQTSERPALGTRLEHLHRESMDWLNQLNPRWIGLEKAVHFKNAASAHVLSEARGVLRLAIHQGLDQAERRLVELSPTAIKKTASGFGMASKKGMLRAILLRFPELVELQKKEDFDFDAFDALAIALTTWFQVRNPKMSLQRSGLKLSARTSLEKT